MHRLKTLVKAGLIAGLTFIFGQPVLAQDVCQDNVLDIRGPWGKARFTIEIADDDEERARGLMFRESLAASEGMLFVYDRPNEPAFWMKNTLIPLDMLFITEQGVVQTVHPMAVPGDLTPIRGGSGILSVLEIRGGMAGLLGITPGSEVRNPAFDPAKSVWPCPSHD
ncbi:MAG TPA: DUF192 domain-containing protein [Aliiroseovarius sp.]|nr:DUF192 domain-containing protein [Aliiroseovarius sp.]